MTRIWRYALSTACTSASATRRGRWTWPAATIYGGCWPHGPSRRAIDLIRRHRPGEVPGDAEVTQLLSREPTPEEAAELADECRRLLDSLQEPELRQIALWKVEGYTHEEIAARLDCVPRTIERKVSRIRLLWKHELEERLP